MYRTTECRRTAHAAATVSESRRSSPNEVVYINSLLYIEGTLYVCTMYVLFCWKVIMAVVVVVGYSFLSCQTMPLFCES